MAQPSTPRAQQARIIGILPGGDIRDVLNYST